MQRDLVLFEDEHLLVINKPAGMNTHSPSPYAGEGLYEWLKNREPRWATLAIIHRLDKETSGVIVFGKTTLANRSLTQQFAEHSIRKKYLLLTDREVRFESIVTKSVLVRAGEKYLSRPLSAGGEKAETIFKKLSNSTSHLTKATLIEAEPVTGKTHQIRVHAAEHGFPILGDTLYGGTPAARVFLHARELIFKHPASDEEMKFSASAEFEREPRYELRRRFIESSPETATNAFRLIHGSSDGFPGLYIDRLGDFLLAQSENPLGENIKSSLAAWVKRDALRGVYLKTLSRHVRGTSIREASPQLLLGDEAPEEIIIRENNVQFSLRFNEGYSVGLFLDQRDNRRRLLTSYIGPEFFISLTKAQSPSREETLCASAPLCGLSVLNTFAYTCGFSVCAAKAGAKVTSLDLSKKYLEWGKRNFALNQIDPVQHDFIFGDVFDWLCRFAKKKRQFDVLLLDPPTFSQSKERGVFRAEKDYAKLVEAALGVLKSNGILFASTNAEELKPEKFLEMISAAVVSAERKIVKFHYVPQPPDFPVSREEPAYLKTVWLRII